jgi:spermidine/putrescine transport system ATP-binding protein
VSEILAVKNLVKSFGDLTAVNNVSFSIEDEFFALLGPSGSGKTTTLRMAAGLELPDLGTISLEGTDITGDPPEKRNINTVFQNYALFPHMTVFENVAFGLRRKKIDNRTIRSEVVKFLEMVKLTDKADRLPKQLSGGEKQRIALIRALINKPKVLLLDEPLGALDLKIRQKLAIDLVNIREQVNITFVYVTHDQSEALVMADRIAVMDKGKILQIGEPKELYENPNCGFVSHFIGNTNILKGKVIEKSGELYKVDIPGLTELWGVQPATSREKISVGSTINVSIRPEKVFVSKKKREETSGNNILSGTVEEVIYVGPSTEFLIRLKDGNEFRTFIQNISPENEVWDIKWEDKVFLHWRFDKTLILPE